MALDFQVDRLEYEDLQRQAQQLRLLGGISIRTKAFDIVDLLYHVLLPALEKMGKKFCVHVDDYLDEPAYVELAERVLYIAAWVLRAARAGDPKARLVVAHEIAHMILHKDQVMAFSDEKGVRLNYLQPEESAEWQAHNFALLLLVTDEVLVETRNLLVQAASIVTLVEPRFIQDRRFEYELRNKVTLETFTGDQCECGSLSVLRLSTSTWCKSCGRSDNIASGRP